MLRACLAALLIIAASPAPADEPTLVVIVHRTRSIAAMSVKDVANIYLKRRRFWEDGAPIVPVNREPGTEARETFSRRILGGASSTFAAFWNEQYFHGVFPPITLSSSAAVRRYTATDPNAIGYVDASEADDSVRVVLRLEPPSP